MKIKDTAGEVGTDQRKVLLARIERYTELPLMIGAVVMIPLVVGPMLWDMDHGTEMTFLRSMLSSGQYSLSTLL